VVNEMNELIAQRSLTMNWRDSIPLDIPFYENHNGHAYCNHTVIRPDYRNSSVALKIAEYTIKWFNEIGSPGGRTSVAPWNLRNIVYHGKS